MHEPAEVAARRASWSDDWQRALPARPRCESRAADRPQQSRPLHEAVLEDGRVPRRARRGGRPVAGRCARAGRARPADARPRARSRRGRAPLLRPARARRGRAGDAGRRRADRRRARRRDRHAIPRRRARRRAGTPRSTRTLPNYTNNLRRFGFGDDDFAERGQRPPRRRDRRVGRPRHDRGAGRRRCATPAPTTCASR